MSSTRYSCQISMKRNFCRQIFEEYSNIKLHENPSSKSRVVASEQGNRRTDGETDRHDELTVTFRKFLNAPQKYNHGGLNGMTL
jgi:hypothetical protein